MDTLYLFIDSPDTELKEWYLKKIKEHNQSLTNDPHPNSGFDICMDKDYTFTYGTESQKVDSLLKCTMVSKNTKKSIGFYTYPRSSISKTPLMLANHVGIIDSGYRGNLIGAFRNLSCDNYSVNKFDRLLQICHPMLTPFKVELVDTVDKLGLTSRGEGGFGSTGK
jgi:dUTP pyrophosphatase